jgi:hypothetical protein
VLIITPLSSLLSAVFFAIACLQLLATLAGESVGLFIGTMTMEFEKAKGTTIHDGRKNLAANIHEHNTAPFVRIGKVTFFVTIEK